MLGGSAQLSMMARLLLFSAVQSMVEHQQPVALRLLDFSSVGGVEGLPGCRHAPQGQNLLPVKCLQNHDSCDSPDARGFNGDEGRGGGVRDGGGTRAEGAWVCPLPRKLARITT